MPLDSSPDDQRLLTLTRPTDWENPQPRAPYHLVVLGAGTAGLVTSAIAAALGARVALIERKRMGGDCLNSGCVPSKSLLHSARLAQNGQLPGQTVPDPRLFEAALDRLRRVRADLAVHDSAARFRDLGVDVYFGEARFEGGNLIKVAGRDLRFRRAAICTGSQAVVPAIKGMEPGDYLTHETAFDLTTRPDRLVVLGGGPVGCELAQAFARLGSKVVLITRGPRLLTREPADAAALLAEHLIREAIDLRFETTVTRVSRQNGLRQLTLQNLAGSEEQLETDALLIAVGRVPSVQGIGLSKVGVRYDTTRGVHVNRFLRTHNRRIFAAGDVCTTERFTHVAEAHARIVVQNALFPHPLGLGRASTRTLVVPRCTYTDPEVASVDQPSSRNRTRDSAEIRVPMASNDRRAIEGQTEGFLRLRVHRRSGRILAANAIGSQAGELSALLSLAMTEGLPLGRLNHVIFPYPTHAEILRRAAAQLARQQFNPATRSLLRALFFR